MQFFVDRFAAYLGGALGFAATSLTLQTGAGASLLIGNGIVAMLKIETPSTGAWELVRATAIVADTVTVERGFGGTQQAFDVDAIVTLVAPAAVFQALMGRKNRLINGCFRLWDYGTNFANPADTTLIANNWRVGTAGAVGTFAISRVAATVGGWENGVGPKYMLRWNQTVAGAAATLLIEQRVEDVRTHAGGKCVVSFLAVAAAGSHILQVSAAQVFGTGGAPSASVPVTPTQSFTVTTTEKRFEAHFDVPSIAGKTLGSNDDHYFVARIFMPGSETFDVQVGSVQVEPGPVATNFEYRNEAEERALAARYFFKTFEKDTAPAQNVGSSLGSVAYLSTIAGATRNGVQVRYPVRMRKSPTLTFFNPSAANANWRNSTGGADSGNTGLVAFANDAGVLVTNPQVAGDNAGEFIAVHMTADANL